MLIRSSKGLFKKAHESVNTFSSRIVTLLVVGTFSLFFFSLCFYSSQQKSITNDEVAHISGGYMIWRTGDFRINVEHPPLVKLFATLPLLDLDLYAPVEDYDWREALEWHFGRGFLFFYNDADSIALFSRCSIMILGFILGWVVYYWGRRLFNTTGKSYSFFAGVFAATLYFTEPNLIAHSSLVTYDMAFALVTVCTGYFYWALLVRGITLRRIVGFVVCIVVAPLVKVIGILLWFLIFVHLGCICLFGKRKWKVYRKKSLVKTISTVREKISYSMALFLVCAAFCYFAIWASYGFRYEISPGTEKPSAEQIKRYLNSSRFASPVLGHIFRVVQQNRLLPQGYEAVIGHAFMEQTRASFLWGTSNYEGGFYSYFLVTTLLKTPLAHLACFMIAVVILIVQTVALRFPDRKKSFNRAMFYFHRAAIPVYLIVGFFVVLSLSRLNIGHRHILMIIPLECMVAGCCFGLLMPRLRPFWRGVSATVFLVILLLPIRLSYPHYISYFNPLSRLHSIHLFSIFHVSPRYSEIEFQKFSFNSC